jgi:Putative amidoligase enzyme
MPLDFGVEIECFLPGQSGFQRRVAEGLARDITEAGVPMAFEGYNHQQRGHWKIVTDASLSGPAGYLGLEFVSPPLNDAGISQIDTVCRLLQANGARTNRSCGLHVHIGARHLGLDTLKRLALLYIQNEDVIDSLMPPSRRRNANERYCASPKTTADLALIRRAHNVQEIAGGVRGGHYPNRFTKINLTSFWKHGTVEFRQHSGTVDAEKIKRWVYFCQKLVDVASVEGPLPEPQTVTPGVSQTDQQLARRLAKIKVAAVIYGLACRPQGVTPTEAREALGWRNTPRPQIDLDRLGVAWYTEGRRNRQVVYKIRTEPGETVQQQAATLASLLEKLGMQDDHGEFWRNRAALLGTARGIRESNERDENPNPHYQASGPWSPTSGNHTVRVLPDEGASLGDILTSALRRREGGES